MSAKLKGRKSKAASLVPLALLSAAWTASIAGADSVASAAKKDNHGLPDGSSVPSQAIKAPASVPIPGAIAPAVPDGAADATVAGASIALAGTFVPSGRELCLASALLAAALELTRLAVQAPESRASGRSTIDF